MTLRDKIKNYFATPAISNSLLSALMNPKFMKMKLENPELDEGDKPYFRVGSAVDCLLTSPDQWSDEFMVVDAYKPYGLLGKFVDHLPDGLSKDDPEERYLEAYQKSGYRMKIQTVIDKFWDNEDAVRFYEQTRNVEDKIILSKDEFECVKSAKNSILSNDFTRKFFFNSHPDIELVHQHAMFWDYKEEKCKGLMDGIMINHNEGWIQPFDLKTVGKSVYEFPKSFQQFGYYRQAAFYLLGLENTLQTLSEQDISTYDMRLFKFIAVENKHTSTRPAVVFNCTANDIYVGRHGGNLKGSGRRAPGYDQLIDDLKWHRQTNKWEMPRELYQASGEVTLDIFKPSINFF